MYGTQLSIDHLSANKEVNSNPLSKNILFDLVNYSI